MWTTFTYCTACGLGGAMLGAFFGVLLMAMCVLAKRADRRMGIED